MSWEEVLVGAAFFTVQFITIGLIISKWNGLEKRVQANEDDIKDNRHEIDDIKYNYLNRFNEVNKNIAVVSEKVDNIEAMIKELKEDIKNK